MITIFILLGLGLLCGGGWAIADGLPYMVLERGFTQVIIGTVLATAGVVILALARVLVEIRRLKATMAGAAAALSTVSTGASPDVEREAAPQAGLAHAGAGVLAGAGATLTGVQALEASASPEWAEEPAEPASGAPGAARDGALAERVEPAAAKEPETARNAEALPEFLPHRSVETEGRPEAESVPAVADAEPELELTAEPEAEAAPLVAVTGEPEAQPFAPAPENQAEADEIEPAEAHAEASRPLSVTPGPADIEDPFAPSAVDPASRGVDEFGLLRESLAGLRIDPEPVSGRIEPTFGEPAPGQKRDEERDSEAPPRGDDLSFAGNWMELAWQRRMPSFGEPHMDESQARQPEASDVQANELEVNEPALRPQEDVGESGPVEPEASLPRAPAPEMLWPRLDMPEQEERPWPPQSREADAFAPEAPVAAPEDEHAFSPVEAAFDPFAPTASEIESAAAAEPDAAAPDAGTAAEPAAPAASNEGVVGAYQVGEAHFTIYADGSIQARTPDGDYSFASMDELKIYLASEKSRLGA